MRTRRTILRMAPKTRQLARYLNDIERGLRGVQRLVEDFDRFEHDSDVLFRVKTAQDWMKRTHEEMFQE